MSYVGALQSLHVFLKCAFYEYSKTSWPHLFSDVSESFSAHCWMGWPDPSLIIGPELLLSGEVAGTEQRRGAELHEVINKKVKIKTNQKKKKGRADCGGTNTLQLSGALAEHALSCPEVSSSSSQLAQGGHLHEWFMTFDHNWPLTSITRSQMFGAHQYNVIFFVLNDCSIQWKVEVRWKSCNVYFVIIIILIDVSWNKRGRLAMMTGLVRCWGC